MADLTRSALNGSVPSLPSQNTLYRWNLDSRDHRPVGLQPHRRRRRWLDVKPSAT
jgi:hypothetical protein